MGSKHGESVSLTRKVICPRAAPPCPAAAKAVSVHQAAGTPAIDFAARGMKRSCVWVRHMCARADGLGLRKVEGVHGIHFKEPMQAEC